MKNIEISTFRYDTTEALFDGSVTLGEPWTADVSTGRTLVDVFERFAGAEVDAAEFGLTFLLRALENGEPLVALPLFPARLFRHSCVFVNADSGIERPEDLVDRTIGEFGTYGQDSGVWAKGALMDDHGFDPARNRWVIGGLDAPAAPFGFTTHPRPEGVDITDAPEGAALGDMLAEGSIDALFTANVPQRVLDGDPRIRRLFTDFESVERDWYRRTGVFPMMHAVTVRRSLLEENPGIDRALFEAYLASKDAGIARYHQRRKLFQMPTMLPWANALLEADVDLMGEDWWPYGMSANRTAIDTYLRYHHEQGLSQRAWQAEDVFAPGLLDT